MRGRVRVEDGWSGERKRRKMTKVCRNTFLWRVDVFEAWSLFSDLVIKTSLSHLLSSVQLLWSCGVFFFFFFLDRSSVLVASSRDTQAASSIHLKHQCRSGEKTSTSTPGRLDRALRRGCRRVSDRTGSTGAARFSLLAAGRSGATMEAEDK